MERIKFFVFTELHCSPALLKS